MNIAIVSVLVLFIILCSESEQRRYFRTPSGRKVNRRLPDGSVKGGTQVQYGPKDDDLGSEDEECKKYGQPTKEVANSFVEITLTPDRNRMLDSDEDQNRFCEAQEKNLKIFEKHVSCMEGSRRKYFVPFLKAMEKLIQKRCNSKAWFEQYEQFSSDCLAKDNVNADIQQCAEKLYRTFDEIKKNTPNRKQAEKLCCSYPRYLKCIENETQVCEKEDTNFIVQTLQEPFSGIAPILCEENADDKCDEQTENTINNVFSKNYVHRHQDIYKKVFDVFGYAN